MFPSICRRQRKRRTASLSLRADGFRRENNRDDGAVVARVDWHDCRSADGHLRSRRRANRADRTDFAGGKARKKGARKRHFLFGFRNTKKGRRTESTTLMHKKKRAQATIRRNNKKNDNQKTTTGCRDTHWPLLTEKTTTSKRQPQADRPRCLVKQGALTTFDQQGVKHHAHTY